MTAWRHGAQEGVRQEVGPGLEGEHHYMTNSWYKRPKIINAMVASVTKNLFGAFEANSVRTLRNSIMGP
jgi:hypothetical protein